MAKRISMLTLLMLLLLCLLPTAVSAAETDGADGGLIQLGTPAELTWGRDYDYGAESYREIPGFTSWRRVDPSQNKYRIIIYRKGVDEPVSNIRHSYSANDTSLYFSGTGFIEGYWHENANAPADCNMESGTYYFTVQALGDGTQYSDSDVAVSPEWTYVKPDASLEAPTNLRWNGRESHWDLPEDTTDLGGYMVEYYWNDPETGKAIDVGGSAWFHYNPNFEDPSDYLENYCIQEFGPGQYTFRVRAVSSDITKVCNSPWSEPSPVYNLTEVSSAVDGTLDELLNIYNYNGGELPEEDKAYLKEDLWAQTDTEELDASMAADQDGTATVSRIAALENLVGGPAGVSVSDDAPEGLTAENISIIGANLNTEGSAAATLNVSAPSKEAVIPELYENTVQFSMKLENVAETSQGQELKVPVKITMPVPAQINPAFLVLLHFHSDGTYEEILFPYIFEREGQTFVSFVVTSFSDFAFAQRSSSVSVSSVDPEAHTVTASVGSVTEGTLVAAVYENGRMTGAAAADIAAGGPKETTLSLPALTESAQVKLFLLDGGGAPLCNSAGTP